MAKRRNKRVTIRLDEDTLTMVSGVKNLSRYVRKLISDDLTKKLKEAV